jgi:hypothetical protein
VLTAPIISTASTTDNLAGSVAVIPGCVLLCPELLAPRLKKPRSLSDTVSRILLWLVP